MASLKLDHIYKVYPNGVKAVNDFTMDIEDGEFIVFVGPSGCGKSTTLRMIAGLEEISAGELYIGDTLVNDMEPKDRDIAMVFQNYALYPHMTVYENMAFGLTLRHMPRNEIHEKVMWAAENLGLKEYLDRKPKAMSGGQRQRVSLGRAILRNPKVMLLDEPLSNLDAKLRGQMRSVISKLHKSLATTFIYVTHDQVEAMTLGTRVVVMKAGRIQQIAAPQHLYDHPVNKFVAGFIGTPQMNFFNVTLEKKGNEVIMKWADVDQEPVHLPLEAVIRANKRYLDGTKPITFGIRCEGLSIEPEDVKKAKNLVNVKVSHFEELGNETLIYGDLSETDTLLGETKTAVIIKATSRRGLESGDIAKVAIKLDNIHLFDSNTEMTIVPIIPDESVLPVKVSAKLLNISGVKVKKPAAILPDELDGFVSIPLSAVKVSDEGEIEGVVGRVDSSKKGNLVYVNLGENIIFTMTDKKVKVGDAIKVTVDYSKVSLLNKDEEVVQEALTDRDDVTCAFVNYKTAYETTKNEEFKAVSDARIAKVTAEFDAKAAKIEEDFAAALSAIDEAALPGIIEKNNAELATRTAEIKAGLAASKAEADAAYKEENKNYAALKKEAVKKIEDEYKAMIDREKADVALIKKTNKDKEVIRARVASFTAFKETLPIQKKNDINNKLNALSFDHDTVNNGIRSKLVRAQFDLKNELKLLNERVKKENAPKEYAEKAHAAAVKTLAKEREEALLSAKLLFFFKFDNVFQMIPEDITNKIIQGLGNKVFTKTFRLCVPHDGFKVVQAGGTTFTVVEEINYETRQIQRLEGTMYGQTVVINMDKVDTLKKGDNVNIEFDVEKCQIFETGMNIRLY